MAITIVKKILQHVMTALPWNGSILITEVHFSYEHASLPERSVVKSTKKFIVHAMEKRKIKNVENN